jgi:uncharacterized membrane protein YfcA
MPLALDVGGHAVPILGLLSLGVVVGFVAGMFGVGGGFLLTPLLSVVFGVPLPIAVGSGLSQMVGTATAALLRHRAVGQGEIRFDIVMLAGSLLGVDAGTRTVTLLAAAGSMSIAGHPVALVRVVIETAYAVLLLGVAGLFWRQSHGRAETLDFVRSGPLARIAWWPRIDLPAVPLRGVSAIVIAEIGLALGFLSGLLGIGGGVALMPVLIYGYGFPIRQAAGTGIVMLIAAAAVGTFEHALRGHVDLRLSLVLLAGSSIAAQFGALFTHRLGARTLRRVFAVVVLVTVVAVTWDLVAAVTTQSESERPPSRNAAKRERVVGKAVMRTRVEGAWVTSPNCPSCLLSPLLRCHRVRPQGSGLSPRPPSRAPSPARA